MTDFDARASQLLGPSSFQVLGQELYTTDGLQHLSFIISRLILPLTGNFACNYVRVAFGDLKPHGGAGEVVSTLDISHCTYVVNCT